MNADGIKPRVLVKTYHINNCRQCPEVRRAMDKQNMQWMICPTLEKVVGKMENCDGVPMDCPIPYKKSGSEEK
jgi:hypothetical protein